MTRLLRELEDTAGFVRDVTKRKRNKIQERRDTVVNRPKKSPLSNRFRLIRVENGLLLVPY